MKKTLLLIGTIIILISMSCCSTSKEDRLNKLKSTHYVDEDFLLLNISESSNIVQDSRPVKIRTWLISRMIVENDSIEFAEINTIIDPFDNDIETYNDCGFIITDSLWNAKTIGSILHFEYIRKNRFYKKLRIASTSLFDNDYETKTGVIIDEEDSEDIDDDLNEDLELMELERQQLEIQRKIDNIKNK